VETPGLPDARKPVASATQDDSTRNREKTMAVPIRFQPLSRDPREELHSRLEAAPTEHAEALLAVYDILQGLHDRGVLAALKGLLTASDFVLESVVQTAETPDAIRRIRNLILLSQKLDSIEPELLGHLIDSVPEGLAKASAKRTEPPGLFSLVQRFTSKESRRSLAVAAEILETFGSRLGPGSADGKKG
jgi:uncharacterized protein YjgD (DUF1641 family)